MLGKVPPERKVGGIKTESPTSPPEARVDKSRFAGKSKRPYWGYKAEVFDRSMGSCGLYIVLPLWLHSQAPGFEPRSHL